MKDGIKEYNNAVNVSIGNQLKAKRLEKKLSIRDVADGCHISKSNYSYYEMGKVSMTITTLISLCDFLGLNYILTIEKARDEARSLFITED